jgi:hypothetical protein
MWLLWCCPMMPDARHRRNRRVCIGNCSTPPALGRVILLGLSFKADPTSMLARCVTHGANVFQHNGNRTLGTCTNGEPSFDVQVASLSFQDRSLIYPFAQSESALRYANRLCGQKNQLARLTLGVLVPVNQFKHCCSAFQ